MTGTCVFCGDRVPPTADDRIRFCGACLARQGPPAPEEPRSGLAPATWLGARTSTVLGRPEEPRARLAPSIVALREHVLSDAPPEVQQRPRYLTRSNSNRNQETDIPAHRAVKEIDK